MMTMSSILRGGGTNDFPLIDTVTCLAFSTDILEVQDGINNRRKQKKTKAIANGLIKEKQKF